ncbi:hypothetical protein CPB84DRAFT_1841010 [Gymnopilus junonius]|uniref:Uncharacterized protein n=1 Tax=Gymnopilus junonius TaxID=109634 RepID=A0A9P5TVC9_GYMJU|nr:hypothetical protein CPB84DRAFT_1841010 [Gymnopilus junonius]
MRPDCAGDRESHVTFPFLPNRRRTPACSAPLFDIPVPYGLYNIVVASQGKSPKTPAHHGTPIPPPQTTTSVNSANLASGLSNEDEEPSQPCKRCCLTVETVLDREVEGRGVSGGDMNVGGAADAGLDEVEGALRPSWTSSPFSLPEDDLHNPPDDPIPPEPAAAPRPQEHVIPAGFDPKIDELRTALEFQRDLENASLDNGDLDEDELAI